MAAFQDLTGKHFFHFLVIKRVENFEGEADSRAQYLCECKCGVKEKVVARHLKNGAKKACKECRPTGRNSFYSRILQDKTNDNRN